MDVYRPWIKISFIFIFHLSGISRLLQHSRKNLADITFRYHWGHYPFINPLCGKIIPAPYQLLVYSVALETLIIILVPLSWIFYEKILCCSAIATSIPPIPLLPPVVASVKIALTCQLPVVDKDRVNILPESTRIRYNQL